MSAAIATIAQPRGLACPDCGAALSIGMAKIEERVTVRYRTTPILRKREALTAQCYTCEYATVLEPPAPPRRPQGTRVTVRASEYFGTRGLTIAWTDPACAFPQRVFTPDAHKAELIACAIRDGRPELVGAILLDNGGGR